MGATLSYVEELWDYGKTRACVCDPMYTEVDCSRKMCPKGNDVLDTRMDTTDKMLYQVQNISFNFASAEVAEEINMNATFALTFKSTINETYTTIPIKLYIDHPAKTCAEMESALLGLPNYVIDGVSVNATQDVLSADYGGISFLVYFTGTSVMGPQNLLMVDTDECGDGCTPSRARTASRTSRRPSRRTSTTTSAAAAASATTTRASATASRATPATSARSRRRSSKHQERCAPMRLY